MLHRIIRSQSLHHPKHLTLSFPNIPPHPHTTTPFYDVTRISTNEVAYMRITQTVHQRVEEETGTVDQHGDLCEDWVPVLLLPVVTNIKKNNNDVKQPTKQTLTNQYGHPLRCFPVQFQCQSFEISSM